MKPSSALILDQQGVVLLQRAADGWRIVGKADPEGATFDQDIRFLRKTALELSGGQFSTKLIVPNDQVLYRRLDIGYMSDADKPNAVRERLEGLTPYEVDELAFDWRPVGPTLIEVAAVAEVTLREAEEFAESYKFNPVCFAAIPDRAYYDGEPYFGETTCVHRFLARGTHVDREPYPINIDKLLEGYSDTTPEPIDSAEPVVSEDEAVAAFSSNREPVAKSDQDETLQLKWVSPRLSAGTIATTADVTSTDEEESPSMVEDTADLPTLELTSNEAPEEEVAESEALPEQEVAEVADDTAALTLDAVAEGTQAEAAELEEIEVDLDPAPEEMEFDISALQFRHHTPDLPAAPEVEAEEVDEPSDNIFLRATADEPEMIELQAEDITDQEATDEDDAEGDEDEALIASDEATDDAGEAEDLTEEDEGEPSAEAPKTDEPRLNAGPKVDVHKDWPRRADRVPTPVAPLPAPEPAFARPTPPGPAISAPVPLAASAAGAATARPLEAPSTQSGATIETMTAANSTLPASLQAPRLERNPWAPEESAGGLWVAEHPRLLVGGIMSLVLVACLIGAYMLLGGNLSGSDGSEFTQFETPADAVLPSGATVVETNPDLEVAALNPLDQPETAPDALTGGQSAITPDTLNGIDAPIVTETGIRQLAPTQPVEPAVDRADQLYLAAIDRVVIGLDAIALPSVAAITPDAGLAPQIVPPGPNQSFNFDERGLVVATRAGALTPDGILVIAGQPSRLPLPRPGSAAVTAPEGLPAERRATLATFRPLPRPEALVETGERARNSGLSRPELATFRPLPRPAIIENPPEPEVAQPTAQAVGASPLPVARPSGMKRAIEQAVAAAAAVPQPAVNPRIPTGASVAQAATVKNGIALGRLNLIGVYGSSKSRRALVRLTNGRFVMVRVGDRLDGGRVAAISANQLIYVKNGRNLKIAVPQG